MPTELSPEAWAQIRSDYEHTDRPLAEICAEHAISLGTLRDRVRRWQWTPRRLPIPRAGPPPVPAPRIDHAFFAGLTPAAALPLSGGGTRLAAPLSTDRAAETAATAASVTPLETAEADVAPVPPASDGASAGTPGEPDGAIVPRLQSAVARVLPAIETTLIKLGAGPMRPREMEQAARALASLTRTLRELNGLLEQRQAASGRVCDCDDMPEDLDAFYSDLARRIDAFVDSRTAEREATAANGSTDQP